MTRKSSLTAHGRLTARAHDDESNASLLSSPASLDVDNTAPTVTIDAVPGIDPGMLDASPTLTFVAAGADDVDCSLDAAESSAFWPCASPLTLSSVSEGIHVVRIRAADLAGNETVVAHTFRVDTAAPETSILDGPVEGSRTSAVAARFEFGSEPGASFACRLDGAALADCSLRCGSMDWPPGHTRSRSERLTVSATRTPLRPRERGPCSPTSTAMATTARRTVMTRPPASPGSAGHPGQPRRRGLQARNRAAQVDAGPSGAYVEAQWRPAAHREAAGGVAPRGTAIEVRCRAPRKACPFRTERLTAPRDGTVSLTRLLRGRRLSVKTRLTVILRRAETMGRWVDYTVGDTGPSASTDAWRPARPIRTRVDVIVLPLAPRRSGPARRCATPPHRAPARLVVPSRSSRANASSGARGRPTPVRTPSSRRAPPATAAVRPDRGTIRLAEAVAQFIQADGDATEGVEGSEFDALDVGVPQPAAQQLEQRERRLGLPGEQRQELVAVHGQGLDLLERSDRRRAWVIVEGRELSDQIAGPAEREDDFAAIRCRGRDLHPSGAEQQHPIGKLALVREFLPARELTHDPVRRQRGGERLAYGHSRGTYRRTSRARRMTGTPRRKCRGTAGGPRIG